MDKKMTLGGFEAVLDSFIPNPDGGFRNSNVDENVNAVRIRKCRCDGGSFEFLFHYIV